MAAQHGLSHINLLPKDSFEFSALGKILKWTTTVGRILVVMTEFVVILAFASRFYFDKKLNDLNDEIEGKLAVIEGYAEVESSMREVLARQAVITESGSEAVNVEERISSISRAIPVGVSLSTMRIETKEVLLTGSAGSEGLFAQTLTNFKRAAEVSKVSLGQTSYDQGEGRVVFNITVTYK
ncbi:MAG: hypothetical protein UW35_C0043G0004 [Candidatus Collierbacteria bacterium GW2011_GWF2_44_15]|uniref:Fimbrial assembly family protein n=4 Tax=Patescibacteria group TaxID=1783273 RepID=A0A0G1HE78_9BACT|nr:MAG: hypothetical protein UR19_C0012G0006 [Candidatus Nomurabacteria bacterium GW2011_GWF1_31_48]KKT34422.1 MAG: hypothetical protein UW23_C0039G0006 [Candidatus Collierbacteria bacterium GW2011_GWA1_44_12]KKT45130.1 MAG: hypothetical protein UW35_C0043G0004 [Candidatus Collierbacteria bacterium GW2011_GWF2_44_15]KKU27966.1 MAG: hypothetical protein UX41_C0041G0004 [Candidatus Collierbacteria bacterium GW2011_GWE1_46_18]